METIHRKTSRKTLVSMGRDVRNDPKKTKLIKWTEHVQDRLKWKGTVEKARTLPELQRQARRRAAVANTVSTQIHLEFTM